MLPTIDPINYVMLFFSYPLFKSFQVAIYWQLCSQCHCDIPPSLIDLSSFKWQLTALCPDHPVLLKIVWVKHLNKLSRCNNTTTLTKTEGHNTTTASTKGAFNNTTPPAVPYGCLDILVSKMNVNILEFFIGNDFLLPLQRISENSSNLVREAITSMYFYESIFCILRILQYQHF